MHFYLKHKKEKSTAIYFLKFADLIEILQQMIFALWALQTLMLIVCPTVLHFIFEDYLFHNNKENLYYFQFLSPYLEKVCAASSALI